MKNVLTPLMAVWISVFACQTVFATPSGNLHFKLTNPKAVEVNRKILNLVPGMDFNIGKYVEHSNLTRQQNFAPLFTQRFSASFLRKPAKYSEVVEGIGDRLRVTRTITLDFKDPCDARIPNEQSFCFKKTNRMLDKKVQADLRTMRSKLREKLKTSRSSSEKQQLQRILAMDDNQLLDHVLNRASTTKTVTRTSIVPFTATQFGTKSKRDISKANSRLPKRLSLPASPATMTASHDIQHVIKHIPMSRGQGGAIQNGSYVFDNKNRYSSKIVTGFRYERNYSDTYVVTFVKGSWWHDRYYASFSYNLYYDFGLQFPFEVTVDTEVNRVHQRNRRMLVQYPAKGLCDEVSEPSSAYLCSAMGAVKIEARPVHKNQSNNQFYQQAGVNMSRVTDEEFVFKVGASCRLYASIPGPNIAKDCPGSFDIDHSKHFTPSLGSQSVDLPTFYIPRDLARSIPLGIDLGFTYAILRPGVTFRGHSGVLTFSLAPKMSRFTSNSNSIVLRSAPYRFQVFENVRQGTSDWGFILKDPKYRFTASVLPKIKAEVGIGVAGYNWRHTFGPYALDALEFDLAHFNFERLSGTTGEHMYLIGTRRKN